MPTHDPISMLNLAAELIAAPCRPKESHEPGRLADTVDAPSLAGEPLDRVRIRGAGSVSPTARGDERVRGDWLAVRAVPDDQDTILRVGDFAAESNRHIELRQHVGNDKPADQVHVLAETLAGIDQHHAPPFGC